MSSTSTGTDPGTEAPPGPATGRRAWRSVAGVFGGFRTFMLRGNIIDLAVGVVIGVAFNDLVKEFTGDFIQPLIKVVGGGSELAGTFTLRHQVFNWAGFVDGVVNFLLVAAALYFVVVLPTNKIAERRARLDGGSPAAVPADVALLTEIRDALIEANRRAAAPGPAGATPAEAAGQVADAPVLPTQPTAADADTTPPATRPPRRTRPTDQPPLT